MTNSQPSTTTKKGKRSSSLGRKMNVSGGGDASVFDDFGVPSSFQGLQYNHESAGSSHHGKLRPGILRSQRRSSEPAVNVRQTHSPVRVRKKNPAAVPAARDLYHKRSLSSSSLQQSNHDNNSKLGDGLHQVRWAAGTTSPSPSQFGNASNFGGQLLYSETFNNNANPSSASSISSELSPRDNKHKMPSHLKLQRNGYSSAPSSRPSSPPLWDEPEDGFGPILRSPLSPTRSPVKSKSHRSSATKRRTRHGAPSQRLSQTDFTPIAPSFGDFAPPGSPSVRKALPASGSNPLGIYNDNEEDMLLVVPPRLWESQSMSAMEQLMSNHNHNSSKQQGTLLVEGKGQGRRETKGDKKEGSKKERSPSSKLKKSLHGSGEISHSSKQTSKSLGEITPPKNGKKKKPKRSSVKVTPTQTGDSMMAIQKKTKRLSVSGIIANIEDPAAEDDNEPSTHSLIASMSLLQDLAPTSPLVVTNKKQAAADDNKTAVTALTAHSAYSTASANTVKRGSSTPNKEDFFLVEMENFRAKSEHKQEEKERVKEYHKEKSSKLKIKKIKKSKKKKRVSVSGDAIEFNVEDLTDNEDEEDDEEAEAEFAIDFSGSFHDSQRPKEIEWNPMSDQGLIRRRNSMPSSLLEYEPVIPSFAHKKGGKSRKSSAAATYAFSITGEGQDPTAKAVNAVLNQGSGSPMGDSSRLSTGEAFEMSHNRSRAPSAEDLMAINPKLVSDDEAVASSHKKTRSSSAKHKKTRRQSMGHSSETLHSTRRGPSGRLDSSNKAKSVSQIRRHSTRRSSTKSKRRGSTSIIELSSSSDRLDGTKPKRREESMPPSTTRAHKQRSKSRSKSPAPGSRIDRESMDVSTATTRSRMKNSSTRGSIKRRGSAPEGKTTSLSSSRRDKAVKGKATSRRERSGSPSKRSKSPKPRGESKTRQKSPKPSTSSKRSGVKSGSRKSSGKKRSSMPAELPSLEADAGGTEKVRQKSRSKSRRQLEQKAMSQSQPALHHSTQTARKPKKRSKSIEHGRRGGSLHTNGTKASAKAAKQKSRRRASMSSVASSVSGQTSLDTHITAPKPPPPLGGQSSWSALTLSTAHSEENGYIHHRHVPTSQLQPTPS